MKPIIFSTDMVKAILDGTKTQTRRVIKPQPIDTVTRLIQHGDEWLEGDSDMIIGDIKRRHKCSYGLVGDRLWVRETWAYGFTNQSPDRIIYKADNTPLPNALERGTYSASVAFGKWAPPIHMFCKDSRITLEITELWAELLRSISTAGAIAEGGYTVEEFIELYLKINHLPDDADPWNWAIRYTLVGD